MLFLSDSICLIVTVYKPEALPTKPNHRKGLFPCVAQARNHQAGCFQQQDMLGQVDAMDGLRGQSWPWAVRENQRLKQLLSWFMRF